jgi:hypothetical protein
MGGGTVNNNVAADIHKHLSQIMIIDVRSCAASCECFSTIVKCVRLVFMGVKMQPTQQA